MNKSCVLNDMQDACTLISSMFKATQFHASETLIPRSIMPGLRWCSSHCRPLDLLRFKTQHKSGRCSDCHITTHTNSLLCQLHLPPSSCCHTWRLPSFSCLSPHLDNKLHEGRCSVTNVIFATRCDTQVLLTHVVID